MFDDDIYSGSLDFLFPHPKPRKEQDGFAAAFFLWNLLSSNGFLKMLQSLPLKGKERQTFLVLLFYLYLYGYPMPSSAKAWYSHDIIRLLCPRADFSTSSLNSLIFLLGQKEFQMEFFKAYLAWIRENYPEDKNILAGIDINLDYSTDWMDELYAFAGQQGGTPVPFQLALVLQKKSGLPLYYKRGKKQLLDPKEMAEALEECKELDLNLMYATLMQYDWSIEDCHVFYDEKGKPLLDYTARTEPSESKVGGILGDEDYYKRRSRENVFSYYDVDYKPFETFVDLEEGKDKAWFCYFYPLNLTGDEIVEEWDEYYYDDNLAAIDPFGIVSSKKRKPTSLLSRMKQGRVSKFIDTLNHLYRANLTSSANQPGFFFILFVAACLKRIVEMALHKAGVRSRYIFNDLLRSGCQILSSQVLVPEPSPEVLRCFQAFGFDWPEEIAIKNKRLDYPFPGKEPEEQE